MNDIPPLVIPEEETLNGTLGVEIVEVTDDLVRGRMPVENRIKQPYGLVHGGAISAIAETLTSLGTARGVYRDGKLAMGQEINASFMRPITAGHVNAEARVRRRGRTAWTWEVEITDDDGRLCALLRATIAVRDAPSRSG